MTFRRQSLLVALAVLPGLLLAGCGSTSASLSSIVITPSPVRLAVGATSQLTVTGTYSDGTRAPITTGVTYSSSAASVAVVNTSGAVTAIGSGTATVTATTSGQTATVTVTVAAGPVVLESIAVLPPGVPLRPGATAQLTVMGTYSDGAVLNVTSASTFSSASSAVATVSNAGLVTAVANGTVTITATHTATGLVGTTLVTVSTSAPTLVSIAVLPATLSLLVPATGQLTVTGTYSDSTTVNLTASSTFVSANQGAATVSAGGLVTSVGTGTAIVTATHTASGFVASSTVTVTNVPAALPSITVAPTAPTVLIGATQQLTVTGHYSDSTTAVLATGLTYGTSAGGVATVSSSGLVTGVGAGSATITVTHTATSLTATSAVTVPAPVTLTSITVAPTAPSIVVGATQQLTVTGHYSDSSSATLATGLTYGTSASGFATVSTSGLVTGVAAGSATITVTHTATSFTATSAVTVTVAPVNPGAVFVGAYSPGVSFVGFGGATNDVTVDPTQQRAGRDSLKFVVTGAAGYSGGAFVAATPRDLTSFNALTFWAKASTTNTLNVTGIGNDAAGGEGYSAENLTVPLTGTWTKYVIPMPRPAKATAVAGLFHLADGNKNYTIWLNDIQYENLGAGEVGAPTGATVNLPATQSIAVGGTFQIAYQPNTVSFALPVLPNAGRLTNVGFLWYTLTSSAPAKATVSTLGLVTGVAAGTANVTAALGSIAVTGQLAVTVTGGGGATTPTTTAAAPTHPAGNVISMYNSSGTYTNVPIDTWATVWGNPNSVIAFAIGSATVKEYVAMSFVGVEFFNPKINATGFTNFHVDVWTPNGTRMGVKLVNFGASTQEAEVQIVAPTITTGTWVSIDIPLSSFTALNGSLTFESLAQLLFTNNNPTVEGATFFIDNVYFWK